VCFECIVYLLTSQDRNYPVRILVLEIHFGNRQYQKRCLLEHISSVQNVIKTDIYEFVKVWFDLKSDLNMTLRAVVTCTTRISRSMERVTSTCKVREVITNWVNRKYSVRITGCQCSSESNICVAENVVISRTGQEHCLSSSECNNAITTFWKEESMSVFTASWDEKQWLWFWQVIVYWNTAAWKWTHIEMFARGLQNVLDIHVRT